MSTTAQPADLTVRAVQQAAWVNKLAQGFNTTDVPLEFCLLQGEVAEAFTAWRRSLPGLGEELADVILFVMSLAEMVGTDLQVEVERKLRINAARVYVRTDTGVPVRVTKEEPR